MRTSAFLLAALPSIASAHGDAASPSVPKVMGGSEFFKNLKARNLFTDAMGHKESVAEPRAVGVVGSHVEGRQATTCGPGVGNCDKGYCCSSAGYCGTGIEYCAAPDCQFLYGPACDANTVPPGASTRTVARTKLGSIPYGGANTGGIQDCIDAGMMALTFDDGPYIYTKDLLDLLDKYNAKATFFITGNNLGKGEIDNCATGYPQLIQRMHASGHQIASHTWSHQNLSALAQADFNNQMYYNEMAFRNILGFFPTYMRPPFSECGAQCSTWLAALGYHATYFDLDTSDYLNDSPTLIQNSKNIFTQAIKQYGTDPTQDNFLVIGHDIHQQTVYNLTEFMLQTMNADGYGTSVTVGQCLGDPAANWYRSAGAASVTCKYSAGSSSSSATSSSPSSKTSTVASGISFTTSSAKPTSATKLIISQDGSCGGSITCQGSIFGNCCSQYSYCGSTTDYCNANCQPAFGSCSITTPSTTTTTSKPSSPATTAPTSALAISTGGNCGGSITCQGSKFGNCCSQYGYCGKTAAYCGTGCQKGFGTCT